MRLYSRFCDHDRKCIEQKNRWLEQKRNPIDLISFFTFFFIYYDFLKVVAGVENVRKWRNMDLNS